MVTREVYENRGEGADQLESFQTMENGVALRREIAVKWKDS